MTNLINAVVAAFGAAILIGIFLPLKVNLAVMILLVAVFYLLLRNDE